MGEPHPMCHHSFQLQQLVFNQLAGRPTISLFRGYRLFTVTPISLFHINSQDACSSADYSRMTSRGIIKTHSYEFLRLEK